MITLLSPALSNIKTKEEALTLLRESPLFKCFTAIMLSDYGAQKLRLLHTSGSISFLIKTYGNYQFPAGIYDTLVTIGSGRGSNWWCLAFPPLCFANEAFIDVPDFWSDTFLICLVLTCLMKFAKKEKPKLRSDFFF